jgi:hypothetical protein
MPQAPANPHNRTQRRADRWYVLLGPEDGTNPTEADLVDFLRPIEIRRTAGGKVLDFARFAYDLGETGERLIDLQTPEEFVRIVEIRTGDRRGRPRGRLLFWGELTKQSIQISRDGEEVIITGRVEPYHFGSPDTNAICQGMEIYDPAIEEAGVTVKHANIAFNPEVDGRIRPNMAVHLNEDEDFTYRLWLEPTQVETDEGVTYNNDGTEPESWTLKEVLRSIQGVCNREQTWIENAVADSNQRIDDAGPIIDMQLSPNRRLPEYLDAILDATGFGWCLDYTLDDSTPPVSQVLIRLFDRTAGRERELPMQAPGEGVELEPAESITDRPEVEWSIADLANEITLQGSLFEREVTLELYRGWTAAQDDLNIAELDPTHPDYDEANANAWRLWVGNEAGDWIGVRPSPALNPIPSAPLDLSSVFNDYIPRRRKLGDCLVMDVEGRRPPVVEWWDATAEFWKPIPREWGYRVLQDQIGIQFTGSTPPAELVAQGDDAKVRVTATIQGDQRLSATAERLDTSPNYRRVILVLDMSTRYHDRRPQTTGDLASVLTEGDYGTDTRDDFTALETEAARIRTIEQPADIKAELALFGLHYDYDIGELITKISGRNISFNRVSPDTRTNYYLQITGIVWQQQPEQRTILQVEPLETV